MKAPIGTLGVYIKASGLYTAQGVTQIFFLSTLVPASQDTATLVEHCLLVKLSRPLRDVM